MEDILKEEVEVLANIALLDEQANLFKERLNRIRGIKEGFKLQETTENSEVNGDK